MSFQSSPHNSAPYPYSTHPPPPPPGAYSTAPPPPHTQHDPFRSYYASRLRELTFNSRPLIQELSLTAMSMRDQQNWSGMRAIVEETEMAILAAPPTAKLPLLYLIDSISKNIGQPYTTHLLPPILPRIYVKAYREVDGHTKSRMEEVIALWGHTGSNGGELYTAACREAVEREIFGSSGYRPRGMPSRQSVLDLLNTTLAAKRREAQWNPGAVTQLNVLAQIGDLVNTTNVAPQELGQIMQQLKAMGPSSAPPPPQPLQPQHQSQPPQAPPQQYNHQPPPSAYPQVPSQHPGQQGYPPYQAAPPVQMPVPHNPSMPPFPPPSIRDSYRQTPTPTPLPAPVPQHVQSHNNAAFTPPPAVAPLNALPLNVADILRNLNTTGLLSQPRTPDIKDAALPTGALLEYEELILGLNVQLVLSDINQPRTLPLAHLPIRCKQCGVRFPEDGKMQQHMDWHFRRNRKERETGGRGAHRSWLPRGEEWVNDIPDTGPEASSSSSDANKPAAAAGASKLTAEKLAAMRKKWVRVPADPVKAAKPCPVCKENFKAEWSEEEEEWIYKNAVDVNGNIYHATCRAEQMSSVLAAKLLKDDGRRSKSKSPRVTPAAEGPKREISSPSSKRKTEAGDDEEAESKRVKVELEPEQDAETAAVEVEALGEARPAVEKEEGGIDKEPEGSMDIEGTVKQEPVDDSSVHVEGPV